MVYPETFKAVGVVDFDDWLHPKSFEYVHMLLLLLDTKSLEKW